MTDQHENLIKEVRKNAHYKERIEKLEALLIAPDEREALLQLFVHGPTLDGDVISKQARTQLMTRGLAWRIDGWTYLTEAGVTWALALEMGREKERRERRERRDTCADHFDPVAAAAHDLLSGCNALLGLLQLLSHRDDISPEARDHLTIGHRIDEARAAIAKAEGKA